MIMIKQTIKSRWNVTFSHDRCRKKQVTPLHRILMQIMINYRIVSKLLKIVLFTRRGRNESLISNPFFFAVDDATPRLWLVAWGSWPRTPRFTSPSSLCYSSASSSSSLECLYSGRMSSRYSTKYSTTIAATTYHLAPQSTCLNSWTGAAPAC